jgi:hypothetical protein
VINVAEDNDPDRLPMLAGTISEGVAREFLAFMKIYEDLPEPDQIATSPETIRVPDEPSILYALTGSIANNITKDNAGQLMKFVKRIPVEFQVVCLRETVRRNKELLAHAALQSWISNSAAKLF